MGVSEIKLIKNKMLPAILCLIFFVLIVAFGWHIFQESTWELDLVNEMFGWMSSYDYVDRITIENGVEILSYPY